jgi:hypothetical protein
MSMATKAYRATEHIKNMQMGQGALPWIIEGMADHAIGWFNIAKLRSPVVAFCTNGVANPCMEVRRYVAFLTVYGIVFKGLGCGCSRWSSTAFCVTGKAFCCIKRVMVFN